MYTDSIGTTLYLSVFEAADLRMVKMSGRDDDLEKMTDMMMLDVPAQ